MGLVKTTSSPLNLLIDVGYFPVHVNLNLLKFNIRIDYPAENLLSEPFDPVEVSLLFLAKSLDFFLQGIRRWRFWFDEK